MALVVHVMRAGEGTQMTRNILLAAIMVCGTACYGTFEMTAAGLDDGTSSPDSPAAVTPNNGGNTGGPADTIVPTPNVPDMGMSAAVDMGPNEPDIVMMEDPIALLPEFSFFVTSLAKMRELSESEDGFGGNLGGLEGADGICQQIAESTGFGAKTWRAFLSVTDGGDGQPVHAIDRIGDGPWYDRDGRLVAENIDGLLSERPAGDPVIIEDLPDENGMPLSLLGDSHDTVTGSNEQGMLADTDPATTCNDWTSDTLTPGRVIMAGHSWPRSATSGREWISDHAVPGCLPGVNLIQNGAGTGDCIGCSGGFGGFYCFALQP